MSKLINMADWLDERNFAEKLEFQTEITKAVSSAITDLLIDLKVRNPTEDKAFAKGLYVLQDQFHAIISRRFPTRYDIGRAWASVDEIDDFVGLHTVIALFNVDTFEYTGIVFSPMSGLTSFRESVDVDQNLIDSEFGISWADVHKNFAALSSYSQQENS